MFVSVFSLFCNAFNNYSLSKQDVGQIATHISDEHPVTCTLPVGGSHKVPHYNEAEITLSESDVPGAKLPKSTLELNLVKDLKRWLLCRGQSVKGNKTMLIAR